ADVSSALGRSGEPSRTVAPRGGVRPEGLRCRSARGTYQNQADGKLRRRAGRRRPEVKTASKRGPAEGRSGQLLPACLLLRAQEDLEALVGTLTVAQGRQGRRLARGAGLPHLLLDLSKDLAGLLALARAQPQRLDDLGLAQPQRAA